MKQVLRSKDLNTNEITYSDPKLLPNGGKSVYLNYNRSPLILQTPVMGLPFGISKFENEYGVKYNLQLSFRGKEEDTELSEFSNKLTEIDEKLIADGAKNSLPWFKKKKTSLEVLKALYSTQIRYSRDKDTGELNPQYPPTFKVKLPENDGKLLCSVYDENREKVEDWEGIINKGAKVQAIIQCVGMWFAGGKYGCSWKALQLKVKPASSLQSYAFLSDSDESENESENEGSENEQELVVEDNDILDVVNPVDEGSEEEEEEEEEVEIVKPKKVIKKKHKKGRKIN